VEKKALLKSTNYKNSNMKGEARKDIEGEVTRRSYPISVIQPEKHVFIKVRSQV